MVVSLTPVKSLLDVSSRILTHCCSEKSFSVDFREGIASVELERHRYTWHRSPVYSTWVEMGGAS